MTIGALPITMAPAAGGKSVATEFGWTPPFNLASKTPRGGVATAGFNLSAFVGKGNQPLAFAGNSSVTVVNDMFGTGQVGQTQLWLYSNGTISGTIANYSPASSLLTPSSYTLPITTGIGSQFEARFFGTVAHTGSPASAYTSAFGTNLVVGAFDTGWVSLSSSRLITNTALPPGNTSFSSGTLQIRRVSNSETISCNVNMISYST
jgi:hypothetical protein